MNVLILNWRDTKHPLAGGAEISLFEHAKYWVKKGAHVTWFCSSFQGGSSREIREGITIIRKGSHYTTHIFAYMFYLRNMAKKVDTVIDCFHFLPFFTPLYIKKNKIIALINEPAKNAWFKNISPPVSLIGYIIEPFFFRFYKNIFFITSAPSIVSELREYGIQKKNIFVIPHGVSIINNSRKFTRNNNVVIYLGQLSEDKGIKDAFYAFGLIKKVRKDMKLWVVGKAPNIKYEEEINQLIQSLSLQDDVTFYGYVSEKKKMELLSKAMILIHPSIREGWGLNIVEANTVGTPAIGYNVTGLKDSIQNMKTGMLTQRNTPTDLASAVLSLMKDRQLYERLSQNAITWSKTFSWDNAGRKSWELLHKVYRKQ